MSEQGKKLSEFTPTPEQWRAGMEAAEDVRRAAALKATPAQRLEWLESAIRFAWAAGALPRKKDDAAGRKG